jgi:uncharacterized protein (DUF488 family)
MAKASSRGHERKLNRSLTLCTIGYEGVTQASVIDALRAAHVSTLIDVRAIAASRRAGFSKTQLAAGLAQAGISYLQLRDLGTPAAGRAAVRAGRFGEMERLYARHLAGVEAQAALRELERVVTTGTRACLLCYEHDPRHCHRTLVAHALAGRLPLKVKHLMPELRPIATI